MHDYKKTIRGLECCQSDDGCIPCALRDCPYRERSDTDCHTRLHRDALELIGEQKKRIHFLIEDMKVLDGGDGDEKASNNSLEQ